jgi:phosphoglycolate phosphatase
MSPARIATAAEAVVIFDLDGTLVDSAPDIAGALNRALTASGLPEFPLADVGAMVGHGARSLCERALKRLDRPHGRSGVDPLLARFLAEYDAVPCRETRPYPGALAALDRLAGVGYLLAICTNKPEPLARAVLDQLELTSRFARIVGGRDGVPLKPSRDMVDLARGGAATAVFVGDSKADVGAAHAAGLPAVLMSHGYTSVPHAEIGADVILDRFEDLDAAIMRLLATARMTAASVR